MQENSVYIILVLSIFFAALVTVYSIYLSFKMKRRTFYLSVFVSLLFLLFAVFALLNLLNNPSIAGDVKYIPLFLFLVLLWGLTLATFSRDLQKKAGKESIKKLQKIDKNEKEYLSKILRRYYKKGKSAEKAIGKNEDTITDPVFLELNHPLFIVGMKNSGKTTIGQIVATKLGVNFTDTDDILLDSIRLRYGSLKHFYRTKGKEIYLQTESLALYNYLKEHKEGSVIALGGGAAENPFLIKMIQSAGYIVYFEMNSDLLYKRIVDDGVKPAFVDDKNPEDSFKATFEERSRVYKNISDIKVTLDEAASPYQNAHTVLKSLDEYFKDEAHVKKIGETAMPSNIIRLELGKNTQ